MAEPGKWPREYRVLALGIGACVTWAAVVVIVALVLHV